jgi:hypothetical protein
MYTHHLQKLARTRLEDVLLDEGILDRAQIELALQDASQSNLPLSQVLAEREVLDEWQLAKLISVHYSLPFVDLSDLSLQWDLLDLLPLEFCYEQTVLPMGVFGPSIAIAAAEMPSPETLNKISETTDKVPFIYVVVRRQLLETIETMARHSGQETSLPSRAPSLPPPPQETVMPTEVSVASEPGSGGDMETGGWEDGGAWESIFDLGDDAVKADID